MVLRNVLFAASAVLVTGVLTTGTAGAAGCNGVVNQFVWGCAAWDNNNGPQYPNYKPPKQAPQPAQQSSIDKQRAAAEAAARQRATAEAAARQRAGGGLIGNDGGTLIGNDGGTFRR